MKNEKKERGERENDRQTKMGRKETKKREVIEEDDDRLGP